MTARTDFTTEEWNTLRDAPHLVALAVAMSGASGFVGTIKEAFSSSAALVEGTKSDAELVRAVCAREEIAAAQQSLRAQLQEASGADFGAAREKVAQQAHDAVRSAVAIAEGKAGAADAAAYRGFLKALGERVANAAKEGGFLGFGGERVSEGEKQMLARLDAALGGVA